MLEQRAERWVALSHGHHPPGVPALVAPHLPQATVCLFGGMLGRFARAPFYLATTEGTHEQDETVARGTHLVTVSS